MYIENKILFVETDILPPDNLRDTLKDLLESKHVNVADCGGVSIEGKGFHSACVCEYECHSGYSGTLEELIREGVIKEIRILIDS